MQCYENYKSQQWQVLKILLTNFHQRLIGGTTVVVVVKVTRTWRFYVDHLHPMHVRLSTANKGYLLNDILF